MKRGVKKVNESITVYCGNARVEVEAPSDLGRNTVVSDVVRGFIFEAKAGEPYEERIVVDCLSRAVVTIEVSEMPRSGFWVSLISLHDISMLDGGEPIYGSML